MSGPSPEKKIHIRNAYFFSSGFYLGNAICFNVFSRFGWFLPRRFALSSRLIVDHWRSLLNPAVTRLFDPDPADYAFIRQQMREPDGR